MVNIKIFCVTKNEYDLIENFILYYGYLFGYNNITIIDNNTTDIVVLKIYEKYINLGINVVYEPNYEGNGQGEIFTKYMNLEKTKCDFLIGLDTDEFLFSCSDFNNGDDPFNKEKILQILSSYDINDTSFKIDSYPCSIVDKSNINYIDNKFINPAMEIIYFSHDIPISENMNSFWKNTRKFFVRSNAFVYTTNGNHDIKTMCGNCVNSSLGILHFNNTGKRRYYERARAVIEGYNYLSTSANISEQIDILISNKSRHGYGHHKVNTYHILLLRMFILEMFITHIKRLPSQEELEIHSYRCVTIRPRDIINIFQICKEATLNKDKTFIFDDEKEKDAIIFYDKPLVMLSYNIFKNTYLQDLLKKLYS